MAKRRTEQEIDIRELVAAEQELANLKAQEEFETQGYVPVSFKEDPIGWVLHASDRRVKVPVKKKTYLLLMLLGAFGAHRFYGKQWFTAVLYLATCWSGFSIAMTLIDFLQIIPMKADENGIIMV